MKGRKVWHVHAHVIIDLRKSELDVKAVRADFRRLTKRTTKRDRSYFGIEEIRSDEAVDRYITKARDVCPAPGVRTLDELDQLAQFLKHKGLFVSWGVKERGKKRSRAMTSKTRRKEVPKAIRTSSLDIEESSRAYDRDDDAWNANVTSGPLRRSVRWIVRPLRERSKSYGGERRRGAVGRRSRNEGADNASSAYPLLEGAAFRG